ncbi:MAG: ATP-dependent Clp protease adaptor ClpS, partial [Actinomyces sp.]|nr:ATP-dependent Clp protease adaptor ClpS [Actinomyces sp.]
VWDDPINSLDYIAEVLRRHFGYPRPTCEALTLQVHSDGQAIIATGLRERVEADLQTLHDYGVQSTLERVT